MRYKQPFRHHTALLNSKRSAQRLERYLDAVEVLSKQKAGSEPACQKIG